ENGFHFCENPIDIFNYYPPNESVYHEVVGSGQVSRDDSDSKIAVSKIKIGVDVGLKEIIQNGIKFIFERVKFTKENTTTGYQSGSQATGDQSGSQATGNRSGSQATGNRSGSQATGDRSGSQATGNRSGSQATGDQSGSQATGDQSGSQATGDQSISSTCGSYSNSSVVGKQSVACGLGYKNKAKATKDSWIVLAERNVNGEIINLKSAKIDGKKMKENTWYEIVDGKFLEVK
ncbi:MAG: hypothetical protein PHS93_09660, partial [Candidatus Omnitrophica bacterium]|nr:hypothetical protein [Candidatus Omnitrophota bacterium]